MYTHCGSLNLLNRRRDEDTDLLVHQPVLRLSADDVLSGRARAVSTREEGLARACHDGDVELNECSGGQRTEGTDPCRSPCCRAWA